MEELERAAEEFSGIYSMVYEELSTDELEVHQVDDPEDEAAIRLPHLEINVDDWQDWKPEKRLEVYLHECAHSENYDDDHQWSFWRRVAIITEKAADQLEDVAYILGEEVDETDLYSVVAGSVHEGVVEPYMEVETVKKCLEQNFSV